MRSAARIALMIGASINPLLRDRGANWGANRASRNSRLHRGHSRRNGGKLCGNSARGGER
jgi:hypothetical protein